MKEKLSDSLCYQLTLTFAQTLTSSDRSKNHVPFSVKTISKNHHLPPQSFEVHIIIFPTETLSLSLNYLVRMDSGAKFGAVGWRTKSLRFSQGARNGATLWVSAARLSQGLLC